jgi:hypothetical protein
MVSSLSNDPLVVVRWYLFSVVNIFWSKSLHTYHGFRYVQVDLLNCCFVVCFGVVLSVWRPCFPDVRVPDVLSTSCGIRVTHPRDMVLT